MKRTIILALPFILAISFITHTAFGQRSKKILKKVEKLGPNPIFYIDSVAADKSDLMKYQPSQIASVSTYTGSDATKLVGSKGKDGVVYIETKAFAKRIYWNYFKTKSAKYAAIVPTPESDSSVQYILDRKMLTTDFEGSLSLINDKIFKWIKIIDKATLQRKFGIYNKTYGVIIKSARPHGLYKARKNF